MKLIENPGPFASCVSKVWALQCPAALPVHPVPLHIAIRSEPHDCPANTSAFFAGRSHRHLGKIDLYESVRISIVAYRNNRP